MQERELILNMVKEGTLSIEDASKLLEIIENPSLAYKFKKELKKFKNLCEQKNVSDFLKNVPNQFSKVSHKVKNIFKSKKQNFDDDIIDLDKIKTIDEISNIDDN